MARIALFQNKNKGSVNENLNAGISAIKEAAENGADLILFPEVQLTEFFPQYPGQDVSGYACELDGEIIGISGSLQGKSYHGSSKCLSA